MTTKELEDLRDWMAKNLALVNAEIKVQGVLDVQTIHLQTGSKDSYGLGLYNGLEMAISLMKNQDPKYLSIEELHAK